MRYGTGQDVRTSPSESCLVRKYGSFRPSASSNMSSRNTPGYKPAAAIELVWWKHAALTAPANSIACVVPSTFAMRCDSASAVRS